MKLLAKTRKIINDQLYDLCLNRHKSIPMQELRKICLDAGLVIEDEGGFIFTGREGRCTIDFVGIDNAMLVLSWNKGQSTYEINSYVS